MPQPGGASSKFGLEYELVWTVNCMLRVMQDDAMFIRLEPPGEEGKGIEFAIESIDGVEHHQVKRQLTGRGRWSLASLASEGVLRHFYQKLDQPSVTCRFVSMHAAHPLDELADRARQSENYLSFRIHFLASNEWRTRFDELHSLWEASDEEETYLRLKRVFVHTIDEYDLRDLTEIKLEACVSGNPRNALDVLAQFALAQTHQTLTPEKIWGHLRSRELNRRALREEEDVVARVYGLNEAYLAGIQPVGVGGKTIRRPEVNQILAVFDDEEARNIVLVTGKAGVGKTSGVAQVLDEMTGRKEPVLSMRLDRLEACATPRELGHALGLPESPVSVLANISEGRNCLLVIDQLDAVSLASGRNSDFFDCISAMLREVRRHPSMRVLVACRKFDVDNDPRIRELISANGIAQEVALVEFGEATVREVVADLGIDAGSLNSKQIKLLSLPVHLRLLAEVTDGKSDVPLGFQTAKELYDAFWEEKKRMMRMHADASTVQRVADLMAENMSGRQALSAPASLLDEHHIVADLMASENILAKDGSRVSFFHESFFDYIFARKMVADNFDASQFILEQGQSLFVRSQIRQVLLHQREVYPEDALRNSEAILNSADIRTHLKDIVLALLGSLEDPTEDEWDVLQSLLGTELSDHVWRAINGSLAWFDLLYAIGVVERWLTCSNEQLVNRAMWFLVSVQEGRAEEVADLLSPFLGISESWNQRLMTIITYSKIGASREFFDFALKAIRAGLFDRLVGPNSNDFGTWYRAKQLAESEPEMACELVTALCERLVILLRNTEDADSWNFLRVGQDTGGEVMEKVATAVPKMFVESLLPFLNDVLATIADKRLDSLWWDPVWASGIRIGGKFAGRRGLDDGFILAMESSLRWLALNEPEEFRSYAKGFEVSKYAAVHNLLMRAYEADGRIYANEAVHYLLTDLRARVWASLLSATSEDVVESLIRSVTPHCSPENLTDLENAILDHYPDDELWPESRRIRGASQMRLLECVDNSRISDTARRRLQELHRKFGESSTRAGSTTEEGGFVGSPIPASAARKMSDDNWLGAMKRYSSDRLSNEPRDWLKGGAIQLSRELETQTKENPVRFANLVHLMPDDANQNYFEAILQGLATSDIDLDLGLVESVCFRCDAIPGRPFGRWITQPLTRFPDSMLSEEALGLIAWYATEHPNPEPGWRAFGPTHLQGKVIDKYRPLDHGINSVRGTAAGAVAKLVFQEERYLSFFKPHLKTMANDPADAVRACVAEALLGTLRYDRDLAVTLFLDLCNADERLLGTPYFERFLYYAVSTHLNELHCILTRMVESIHEEVSTAGARQICLASLSMNDAVPLAQRCVSGSVSMRVGAAEVYATNIRVRACREKCKEMLSMLFTDEDKDVRAAASRCFMGFEGNELRDYADLVEAYIESPAFEPGFNPLIDALRDSTANMPNETLLACERWFDLAGTSAGDVSTRVSADSSTVINLVIRVYSKATTDEVKSKCLDLIDKAKLLGAYGVDRVEDTFDR